MPIHEKSEGYREGADAYVSGRPGYPPEVAGWLRTLLGVHAGSRVLEVGAGTGKFLPVLKACGAHVVALEPVDAMRERLVRAHPDVEAISGTAESIPLPDASIDVIICAQAFHWFATPAALAEMRRVLVPGGMLGLIWNVRDERPAWMRQLSAITDPYEDGAPRYRTGAWKRVFPAPGFEAVGERAAPHHHKGPAEQVVVERTLSTSFIAGLPQAERDRIAGEVRELIARTPELAGPGNVDFPYETRIYAFQKTGD